MPIVGGFFVVLYICFWIGIGIYILTLMSRFVRAHERIASALERSAHHQQRE